MEKTEIHSITAYVNDLYEDLYNFDLDQTAMQTEHTRLYQTIKKLMDATFESTDPNEKTVLARLELRARKCYEAIEERISILN